MWLRSSMVSSKLCNWDPHWDRNTLRNNNYTHKNPFCTRTGLVFELEGVWEQPR